MAINKLFTRLLFPVFLVITLMTTLANAATYTVTRSDDRDDTCTAGDCSLREAVKAANFSNEDDLINFSPDLSTVNLSLGQIVIDTRHTGILTISGNGADVLKISANNSSRIFSINYSDVEIEKVTLTGGKATGDNLGGGAIYSLNSALNLDSVFITGNTAGVSASVDPEVGGGLAFQDGVCFIVNSTIANNQAFSYGGGIYDNNRYLNISNSTISGNTGYDVGGGIYIDGNRFYPQGRRELWLTSSTVTKNVAAVSCEDNCTANGGGIGNLDGYIPIINLFNTIIAEDEAQRKGDSAAHGEPEIFFDGMIRSTGYNLIYNAEEDTSGIRFFHQPTDIFNKNPYLGPLQNNGGTMPTHALLFGSPAIDAGWGDFVGVSQFDQRGYSRIVGGAMDIGAFEFAPRKSRKRTRFF